MFNFNGVYIPREGTSVGLFDVASVELLPGPQGTLYGRAALGGTVNVEFNRPTQRTRDERAARSRRLLAACTARSCRTCRSRDTFALRGAFDYIEHDGYLRDGRRFEAGLRRPPLGARTSRPTRSTSTSGCTARRRTAVRPTWCAAASTTARSTAIPNAYDHDDPWNDRIDPGAPTASPNDYENFGAGAQVDWRLGRPDAHVPAFVLPPRLGRPLLAREHRRAADRALRPGDAGTAPRERRRRAAALARRAVLLPGHERRRFLHYTNTPAPFPLAQISRQPPRRLRGLRRRPPTT